MPHIHPEPRPKSEPWPVAIICFYGHLHWLKHPIHNRTFLRRTSSGMSKSMYPAKAFDLNAHASLPSASTLLV